MRETLRPHENIALTFVSPRREFLIRVSAPAMHSKARFRLTELLIAIALVAVALVWAERTAWRQIVILKTELNARQIDRFRSADRLRAGIVRMQNLWRADLAETNVTSRTDLVAEGRTMQALIVTLADKSRTPTETQVITNLGGEFEDYLRHVSASLEKARTEVTGNPSRTLNEGVEVDFEQLMTLTENLTAVNRADAERFLDEANAALTRLQLFLFASLLVLLGGGTALIALIYRRTVTPLRNTLIENRTTIERQEKLASLGVLATGIAHEIRNPLTAIKVRLFTLKSSHQPGSSEHEDLEVIRVEIDRLERIVRDFLQFARPSEPELQTMPAEKLLRDIQKLLHASLALKKVDLKLELLTDAQIRADLDKLKQVLLNFVQNGADSMPSGGVVTLRLRREEQLLNGRWVNAVIIDVADEGGGIPPEVQKRLFDPFFTTKEAGTGLGLPIAARIVEKHGGVIQYETRPNRGTTFSIVLPPAPPGETSTQL
jgi:signal transduction histidine kinase